jgi:S-adenosylmethionine-diacylglycerol 3-amino-3-carboxypropyl transferase
MGHRDEAPYGQDATKDRLLFAVIREDPRLEGELILRTDAKKVLTVASGGCVALSIASRFPRVAVTAFDRSQAQLDHVKAKLAAAIRREVKALNVEDANAEALNQCGEFEKVFRILRKFFEEFIAPHHDLLAFFTRGAPIHILDSMARRWTTSRYWPAAFHACFTDELLKTTLGTGALRHAAVGSYPDYFQRAFARGLRRDSAPENPFLQHVFLGGYRRGCEPDYIRSPEFGPIQLFHGELPEIADVDTYDLVSLSNVFDRLDETEIAAWTTLLKEKMKPGATLLVRQFNSSFRLRPYLESEFTFDSQLGRSFFYRDRSLFYERFEVGKKREAAVAPTPA